MVSANRFPNAVLLGPDTVSRPYIECADNRQAFGHIAREHEQTVADDGREAGAVVVFVSHVVSGPEQTPVRVRTHQAAIPEIRAHMLPVGDWGRRSRRTAAVDGVDCSA